MLVSVPVGIVLGVLEDHPAVVFITNFFAIVPLAALLSFATEGSSVKPADVQWTNKGNLRQCCRVGSEYIEHNKA
jgi:hypothetical protein